MNSDPVPNTLRRQFNEDFLLPTSSNENDLPLKNRRLTGRTGFSRCEAGEMRSSQEKENSDKGRAKKEEREDERPTSRTKAENKGN
ncbi:uncharacterized protein LOC129032402 isoform X2 [Pongo pygmaeus]|uniref:uncharacterized protein LOC129032402 isoform X2 n=1 Tax=Pongo pygmaeus TaxID=9600 RepID=UPI00300C2C32